ncbi:MAG TPA: hypothetical protein VMN60_05030 [Longimicrobiales bacterium]|nr:hypothetical protein [Longimicrobiales bacterium]
MIARRRLLAFVAVAVLPVAASAQVTAPSCGDQVSVVSLVITPRSPTPGAVASIDLLMKNVCSGTSAATVITVPWRITAGTVTLASGAALIPPGGTGVGKASWKVAAAGSYAFDAEADPRPALAST